MRQRQGCTGRPRPLDFPELRSRQKPSPQAARPPTAAAATPLSVSRRRAGPVAAPGPMPEAPAPAPCPRAGAAQAAEVTRRPGRGRAGPRRTRRPWLTQGAEPNRAASQERASSPRRRADRGQRHASPAPTAHGEPGAGVKPGYGRAAPRRACARGLRAAPDLTQRAGSERRARGATPRKPRTHGSHSASRPGPTRRTGGRVEPGRADATPHQAPRPWTVQSALGSRASRRDRGPRRARAPARARRRTRGRPAGAPGRPRRG